jgi:hypothetical protein
LECEDVKTVGDISPLVSTGTVNGAELTKITAKEIPQIRAKLLKRQKGKCPICARTIVDPVLDHDHSTGAVRDALCRNCNRFEGKVLQWAKTVPCDNVTLVRRLGAYWLRHSENKHGYLHPNKITKRKRRKKNAGRTTRTSSRSNRDVDG